MPSNSQQAHYSLQQASRRAGFHHSDRKNERNKNTVKFLPKKRKEKSTRDFHSWSPFSKDPPFHFFHSVYLTQRKCVSLWLCGKLRGGYPCTGMLCRERQPHSSQLPVCRGAEWAPYPRWLWPSSLIQWTSGKNTSTACSRRDLVRQLLPPKAVNAY